MTEAEEKEVTAAIEAAKDIDRWDVAQRIAEDTGFDVCLLCLRSLATGKLYGVHHNMPAGVQVCEGCVPEDHRT